MISQYQHQVSWWYYSEPAQVAPTDLAVIFDGIDTASLSWTDTLQGNAHYSVQRRDGVGGVWTELAVVGPDDTTYDDVDAFDPDTRYFYRVVAVGGAQDGAASNIVHFKINSDAGSSKPRLTLGLRLGL